MNKLNVEIINLEDDDEPQSDTSSAIPDSSKNLTLTSSTQDKLKNLHRAMENGKTVQNGPTVANGISKRLSLEFGKGSNSSTTENENEIPSSTIPETPTTSIHEEEQEMNLFEMFKSSASSAVGSPLNDHPSTSGNEGTKPRKRRCPDGGIGEELIRKEKEAAAVTLKDYRKDLNDRASSKFYGKCACEKHRRDAEQRARYYKERVIELQNGYKQLQEEMKILRAKTDAAAPQGRRTVALQVDLNIPPAQGTEMRAEGSSATAPKPKPPTTTLESAMPNLVRYPIVGTGSPSTMPIRQPASAPTASPINSQLFQKSLASALSLRHTTPIRITSPSNKDGKLPTSPRVPQTGVVQSPNGFVIQQQNTLNGRVTMASLSGSPVTMKRQNGAWLPTSKSTGSFKQAGIPPKLVRAPSASTNIGNQVISVRPPSSAGSSDKVTVRTINRDQAPSPRKFVELSSGMGPPPTAVGMLRPASAASAPSRQPNPAAASNHMFVRNPAPPAPRRVVESCAFPQLPTLRSHVPSSELTAASAVMRPLPPKPTLTVTKNIDGGVTLSWDLPTFNGHLELKTFRVYSYRDGTNESWNVIGEIEPMELPMACTLSSCLPNNKYYFALTAEDVFGRFGPFSDVSSIYT